MKNLFVAFLCAFSAGFEARAGIGVKPSQTSTMANSAMDTAFSKSLTPINDKTCSIATFTKSCGEFLNLPAVITLSDGTSFKNPSLPKEAFSGMRSNMGENAQGAYGGFSGFGMPIGPDSIAKMKELTQVNLDFQVDGRSALESSVGPKLNGRFITSILQASAAASFGIGFDPKTNKFIPAQLGGSLKNGSQTPPGPSRISDKSDGKNFNRDKQSAEEEAPGNYGAGTSYIGNFEVHLPRTGKEGKLTTLNLEQLLAELNSLPDKQRIPFGTAFAKMAQVYEKHQKSFMDLYKNAQRDEEENRKKRMEFLDKRKKKAAELVSLAKASMIKKLLGNYSESEVSSDIKALVDKIRSIEFKPERSSTGFCKKRKDGEVENAYYNDDDHSFTICDGMLGLPDSNLISIIGHEMGHSIDPCNISNGVSSIDPTAMKGVSTFLDFSTSDKSAVGQILSEGVTTSAANLEDLFSPRAYQTLVDRGAITNKIKGLDSKQNPLAPLTKCLIEEANFRDVGGRTFEELMSASKEGLNLAGKSNESIKKFEQVIRDDYRKHPYCRASTGYAVELGEASSDMWGAVAQADFLKDNPPKSDLERTAAFADFIDCTEGNQFQGEPSNIVEYRALFGTLVQANHIRRFQEHPRDNDRLNKVSFANPDVAAAMGCKRNTSNSCYTNLEKLNRLGTSTNSAECKQGACGKPVPAQGPSNIQR